MHHSPLRSRGASARRAPDTARSQDRSERKKSKKRAASKKKNAVSSRSKSRPKSTKGKSNAGAVTSAALKKEFHNFKRGMTAKGGYPGTKDFMSARATNDFDSIVTSPS